MPPENPSRSLLIKPVSGDCNLHCTYCFYHERSTDPYRDERRHRMSPEVLERVIAQGMALDRRQATFGWQGGEPTLAGLDFFRQVVELQKKHGAAGQVVSNGLQTNGLLLDPEWARFLRQYNFLLGVSLDGPALLHDHYRITTSGSPTQRRVLDVLRMLGQWGVEFNILAVVNRLTAERGAEIYDYLVTEGFDYLQFIPCVEVDPQTGELTDFSVTAEQFGDFLCAVFDRWYNGGDPRTSVRDFDAILAVYAGQEAPMCCYQPECGSYVVVEYNGDVYPCDFYVREDLRLGNVMDTPLEKLFAGEGLRRFAGAKADPRPECQVCAWFTLCQQGCPRFVGVCGQRSHYLCRAYQRFFAHSQAGFMELRERVLAQRGALTPALSHEWEREKALTPSPSPTSGRGEEDRRGQVVSATAPGVERLEAMPKAPVRAVGRNDPCPCGSGRKYKHCCGRKGAGA
jgi:uncharacterized protein